MERWAATNFYQQHNVKFFCVCVDTQEVALMFQDIIQFRHAINAWIPRRDLLPSYGQLGCSGFIVVDSEGDVLSKKTLSFNKLGPDVAFGDVERIVREALGIETENHTTAESCYAVGRKVRIENFASAPEFDGLVGTIARFEGGCFLVLLVQGTGKTPSEVCVPPCSLVPADREPGPAIDIESIKPPPLLNHAKIDAEHKACTDVLNALLLAARRAGDDGSNADPALTSAVVACLDEHFAHEEQFATDAGFGQAATGFQFSALAGHIADHKRILALARLAEKRACSRGSASVVDAQALALAFNEHASNYDVLLENCLSQVTAAASSE